MIYLLLHLDTGLSQIQYYNRILYFLGGIKTFF